MRVELFGQLCNLLSIVELFIHLNRPINFRFEECIVIRQALQRLLAEKDISEQAQVAYLTELRFRVSAAVTSTESGDMSQKHCCMEAWVFCLISGIISKSAHDQHEPPLQAFWICMLTCSICKQEPQQCKQSVWCPACQQ